MSTEAVQIYQCADPVSAIEKTGAWIARSGIMPLPKQESGQAVAIVMAQTGMNLLEVAATYHIMTDGRWAMKADAALARFRNKGGKHKWLKMGDDLKEAAIELTYDGQTLVSRFTMDMAKRMEANFKPGSNWSKSPDAMLRARAVSRGITMIAPEIYSDDFVDVESPLPEMNLAQPAPEKVANPKFKPTVVTTEPAPEATPEPQPEPAQSTEAEVVVEQPKPRPVPAGELPVETVKKLMTVIGDELADAALNYMTNVLKPAWLQPGQSLSHLSVSRANMILNGVERFKTAVKNSAGK